MSDLLEHWLSDARLLETRPPSRSAALRLQDFRRLAEELCRVLAGQEDGEGSPDERTLHCAKATGRIQAVTALFACPRATFVEYLLAAPWNLLGAGDASDLRSVHGAGHALIAKAADWTYPRGCGGRVALQAENPRCLAFYQRIGFARMEAADHPLSLVPRGAQGWSPAIRSLVDGRRCSAEGERSPWLVLEPRGAAGAAIAS